MRIDYDANVASAHECVDAELAHTSDDSRTGHSWVPREIFSMARTPLIAACQPSGHTLVGWNTRGDGTGESLELGASLPQAWESGTDNENTLYAQWAATS